MSIEIVEPDGDGVVLHKHEDSVLVWCDCHLSMQCPQGKIGSQTRCRVWLKREHVSEEYIAHTKRMNRFDR